MNIENIANYIKEYQIIIGIIITAIIIPVIILAYRKIMSRGKQIAYIVKTYNITSGLQGPIEFVLKKQSGKGLSISKIGIWNCKSDIILKDDITKDKIYIFCDVEILFAKILFKSNRENDFSMIVSEDRMSIAINFNHLSRNDTIIISLGHEPVMSLLNDNYIRVSATLKSGNLAKKIKYDYRSKDIDKSASMSSIALFSAFSFSTFFCVILSPYIYGKIIFLAALLFSVKTTETYVKELKGLPHGNKHFQNEI